MLVDNKFIIILIPRCATTSFIISCNKYNIPTNDGMSDVGGYDKLISFVTKGITHFHNPISFLTDKFGDDYPIIAVRRNKYDSFISLWKMILNILDKYYNQSELVKILSKFKTDNILFFDKNDYKLKDNKDDLCNAFFVKNNIPYNKILAHYLPLLYVPTSYWHNFDKRIIWFDFDKLNELEDWVSDKLDMEFKLENINSSKEIISEFKNDDYFKEKFDYIYYKYEVIKENKTLI